MLGCHVAKTIVYNAAGCGITGTFPYVILMRAFIHFDLIGTK